MGKKWPSEPFICYGEFEEKITLARILQGRLPSPFLRASPTFGPARAFPLCFPFAVCSERTQPPCARPEGSRSRGLWDRRDSHAGLPRGFSERPRRTRLSGSGGRGASDLQRMDTSTCPAGCPGLTPAPLPADPAALSAHSPRPAGGSRLCSSAASVSPAALLGHSFYRCTGARPGVVMAVPRSLLINKGARTHFGLIGDCHCESCPSLSCCDVPITAP